MSRTHRVRLLTALIPIIFIFTAIGHTEAQPSSPQAPVVVTKAPTTVKLGDSGPLVLQVQYVLKSYGYAISTDGTFGPVTLKRVIHWQKVNGLVPDGVVGPLTLRSMGLSGRPASAPHSPSPAPKPAPAPSAPTYNGGATGADQWHDLALSVGWTEAQWPTVRCIISRESRGIPTAANSAGATGLMQVLQSHRPGMNLKDPRNNLTVALELYRASGWTPWYHRTKPCY